MDWREGILDSYTEDIELTPASNSAKQILLGFNKRDRLQYFSIKRKIYLTQQLGEKEDFKGRSLLEKDEQEDVEYFTGFQYLIPASEKQEFLLNFLVRVPGLIYNLNVETAMAAGTNLLLAELLGSGDKDLISGFCANFLAFIRGVESRWMPYLLLAATTSSTHPSLPMELRVNALLGLLACLLETMCADGEEDPNNVNPRISMVTAETLRIPLTSLSGPLYKRPNEKTSDLVARDNRRRNTPGFWTDLSCHFRCIMCSEFLVCQEENLAPSCPFECQLKEGKVRCSLCDEELSGMDSMKLHFTTLCKRPISVLCPACGYDPTKGECFCQTSRRRMVTVAKNIIASPAFQLFKPEYLQVVSAICYHHYVGNLTFTRIPKSERNLTWWCADQVKKADYDYVVDWKSGIVEDIVGYLPTMSEDGEIVSFPGTNSETTVESLITIPLPEQPKENDEHDHTLWSDKEDDSDTRTSLSWDAEGLERPKRTKKKKKEGEARDADGEDKDKEERKSKKGDEDKKKKEKPKDPAKKPGGKEGDDGEDDDDEDEDEEEEKFEGFPFFSKKEYKCRNETHDTPLLFASVVEKLRHLVSSHSCPFKNQNCKYYSEFEYAMAKHIKDAHSDRDLQPCSVYGCNQTFATDVLLETHLKIHPKCFSCQQYFFDAKALETHHPCYNLKGEPFEQRDKNPSHLAPVFNTELDQFRKGTEDPNIQLATCMANLCQKIPMAEDERDQLVDDFRRAAAHQIAQQNLERYPASARKLTRLLIEPPIFNSNLNVKENMQKVSDFLGKGAASGDIWEPSNSAKAQFKNFLTLSELNERMSAATAACKLYESSACSLLLQRFSVTAKNAIEARLFSPPSSWSYREILLSSQSLYFYLNLEDIAIEAEECKKKDSEGLTDFSSRLYKMLWTASLGREQKERENYISSNMRRLIFRALSPKLRAKVENLELRYGISYTSNELIDFSRSEQIEQSHLRGETLSDSQSLTEKGKSQIYSVQKKNQRKPRPKSESFEGNVSEMSQKEVKPKKKEHKDRKKLNSLTQKTSLGSVGQHQERLESSVIPRSPYPQQGMAKTAVDLYKQANKGSKSDYIKEKKTLLGLDPNQEIEKFCFKCGAEGLAYHPAGRCKLPDTTEIHDCGHRKLFHRKQDCPNPSKKLRSIKVHRM